ncbi:MAG: hypothetical protein R3B45_08595 [Bdellovibrionota bacterium]
MPLNKMKIILTIFLSLGISQCGDSDKTKSPKRDNSTNLRRSNGQDLMSLDPNSLTDSELKLFISQLISRDQAEAKELVILKQVNKDLCDRLQKLRTDCSASSRIIPDGSEKILGCSGAYSENINIEKQIKVNIDTEGSFYLLANKNFKSSEFSTGNSAIKFVPFGENTTRAPRFIELTSLRLVPVNGESPALESLGFELSINENTVFDNSHLVWSQENGYFKIDPNHLFEIKKSPTCTVTIADIQEIRNRVLASMAAPQPVMPQNQNISPGINNQNHQQVSTYDNGNNGTTTQNSETESQISGGSQ